MEVRGALVRTTTGMETSLRVDTWRKDSGGKFKSIKEVVLPRRLGPPEKWLSRATVLAMQAWKLI